MHPRLLTLACHVPAVAWGGQSPDEAIDALVGAADAGHGASGPLLMDLVAELRHLSATNPEARAVELYSLLPVAPGDLSALPANPELSAVVTRAGGALLVRNPSTDDGRVVMHTPGPAGAWAVETITDVPMAPQPESVSAATAELTDAVHRAAAVIAAARQSGRGFERGLTPQMPASTPLRMPQALASRELSLLDRADSVEQIRDMANAAERRDGAVAEQQPQLWGLQVAVNQARRAVVASLAERQRQAAVSVRTAD